MDWLDTNVDLDASAAAVIAQGMREVAQADGVIHQRELQLIATFEADIPPGGDADAALDDEVKPLYLRSLIMVALADGVITDKEAERINALADAQAIGRAMVHSETLEVKRWFLQAFQGVSIFRDAVVRVANDLGLDESEVAALRSEA